MGGEFWKMSTAVGTILIVFITLLSFVQLGSTQEFVSCRGFVEASDELGTQKPDYSFIKVHLISKSSSTIKESTECAPNGFFLLPIYDSGDFELKVEGPQGWNFEPSNFPVTIENGKCNGGNHIKFLLTGFSVFGRIVSPTCGDVSLRGVTLQLVDNNGKSVGQTTTSEDGTYHFFDVLPGTFTIQATHPTFSFSTGSTSITVEWGNTDVEQNIEISGYAIRGNVFASSVPIDQVNFKLFPKGSDAPIFEVDSVKGEFLLSNVPCGEYVLVPIYLEEETTYDVSPPRVEVKIVGNSVALDDFQVVGFSVRGKVVDMNGVGIGGVSVLVDGVKQCETREDGKFTWEKASTGTYKVELKKDHYYFPSNTVTVSPTTSTLADIQVESFGLCGKFEVDETSGISTSREATLEGENLVLSAKTTNSEFCFKVKPGSYTIQPRITEQERAQNLLFEPAYISVRVENWPILDQNFSQIKVSVSGNIQCLESDCTGIEVILESKRTNTIQRTASKGNKFEFQNVYPGSYVVRVQRPMWCWEFDSLPVEILRDDVNTLKFTQTGFKLEIQAEHELSVVSSHQQTSEKTTHTIYPGPNTLCLVQPGDYTFQPKSCFKFEKESYEISTKNNNRSPINLLPTHVQVTGQINIDKSSTLDSVEIQISNSNSVVATRSGKDQPLRFSYWASAGETHTITPQVKSSMLFYPKSQNVAIPKQMKCQEELPSFEARDGKYITGNIHPVLEKVEVIVRIKQTSEIIMRVLSDTQGRYSVGPLYDDIEYSTSAHLEGYHFTSRNGDFVAVELRQFTVLVQDTNELPVSGVIITLTGVDSFYNSSVTDEEGRCVFGELFPGSYYLKPALKEYTFQPSNLNLEITENSSLQEKFVATRVAYSCFGSIKALNGDPEKGVLVYASNANGEYEETHTDSSGKYRIRGLKPGNSYSVSVKPSGQIVSASPSNREIVVSEQDSLGADFVAFRGSNKYDIYGFVTADAEFLSTLSVELYIYNKNQHREELVKSINLGCSSYFDFPLLPENEEFIIQLATTLNSKQYDFDLPREKINIQELVADGDIKDNRYFVPLTFSAKLHMVPSEIANVSFYPLPILVIGFLAYWYRDPLRDIWNPKQQTPKASAGWGDRINTGTPTKRRNK